MRVDSMIIILSAPSVNSLLILCFFCARSSRFGRKPTLFSIVALQSVTLLIQATSVNWVMFCFVNFLRGLGSICSLSVALILGEGAYSTCSPKYWSSIIEVTFFFLKQWTSWHHIIYITLMFTCALFLFRVRDADQVGSGNFRHAGLQSGLWRWLRHFATLCLFHTQLENAPGCVCHPRHIVSPCVVVCHWLIFYTPSCS